MDEELDSLSLEDLENESLISINGESIYISVEEL